MQLGIIGLPNVGKSTLFNALSSGKAACSNYPFCTIEPNVGIVEVPDRRLEFLGKLYQPQKLTPTTVRFVDIAGLVKGASKGEGLGNKFLSHIREMDALIHLVRCFRNPEVAHSFSDIDPVRDLQIVQTELTLADLEIIDRRLNTISGKAKCGDKKAQEELVLVKEIKAILNKGEATPELIAIYPAIKEYNFLSLKPVIYVANIDEGEKNEAQLNSLRGFVRKSKAELIELSVGLESEIVQLSPEEGKKFRQEWGITETGLERLIVSSYRILGLITFFTVVGEEIRAWTITKGTPALKAAGKIHSDMERGFIRAEVFNFDLLEKYDTEKILQEKGLIRSEGKDYIVQDGDIIRFRFNV